MIVLTLERSDSTGLKAVLARLSATTGPGLPIYLWLVLLVVMPNILLFGVSFLRASGGVVQFDPTLANYARLAGSESFWVLLMRTLLTAAVASAIATLIAFPMAYYASRKLTRGRLVALFLVVLPLWISLLMRVFAWKIILGEFGVLNSLLLYVGILEQPSPLFLYTSFSVLLTFAYVAIPFVFVTSYSALERIPHTLVEAAQDSGASPWRTFTQVMWPLSRSGAAIGFALAFLLCVGDYVTPAMVGGLDGTMLGMVVASQFGLAGNWPYGSAIAFVMMAAVSLVLALLLWASQTPGIITGEDNGGAPTLRNPPVTFADKAKSYLGFAAFCLPYLFLYLPLALIVLFSFNDSKIQIFPLTGFTLQWYGEVFHNEQLLKALGRSIIVGSIVLAISMVFGTLFALILAYGKLKAVRGVELLLAVPVAIPGVVLGISLVLACQMAGIPSGLPRIVAGHCSFVMPVILMIVLNRLRRLDPSLVEAAMDCGADRLRAFVHVLLPLIRGSILGGALLGFTLSVDEVVVTSFLAGADPTLPVWVWNQMRFGFTPSVNAIFTCIGVLTVIVLIIAQNLTRNRS